MYATDSSITPDSIAAYGSSSQLGGGIVVSSIGGPLAPPSRTPRQDPDMAALQVPVMHPITAAAHLCWSVWMGQNFL